MGKSTLLPGMDSEAVGGGFVGCRRKAAFYSVRCLRHSRIAGRERGGRHLEIALEFFGQLIMKLRFATPATAQAPWGGRGRCPRGLVA